MAAILAVAFQVDAAGTAVRMGAGSTLEGLRGRMEGLARRTCRSPRRLAAAVLVLTAASSLTAGCGGTAPTTFTPAPVASSAASSGSISTPSPAPSSRPTPAIQRTAPRPAGSATKSVPAPPSLIGVEVPTPVRIRIPAIGVDSGLDLLDRNPDGTIQLPPDLGRAGWYRRGIAPADLGTAVIMGDVGSPVSPGVFSRLSELRAGDEIRIQRANGTELLFITRRSLVYSPEAFPTAEVYPSGAGGAELRVITCG